MPLTEKPHRLRVEILATAEIAADSYEGAPEQDTYRTMHGQVTPKGMAFGLENYGVELARPYKLMADPEEEVHLKHGARVLWLANSRERTFYIRTPVRYHGQGDDCDHVSVLIEEDFGA